MSVTMDVCPGAPAWKPEDPTDNQLHETGQEDSADGQRETNGILSCSIWLCRLDSQSLSIANDDLLSSHSKTMHCVIPEWFKHPTYFRERTIDPDTTRWAM